MTERLLRDAGATLYELCWLDSADAMLVANAQTRRLVEASPAAEKLTGRSRTELIGMSISDLHPECEVARLQEAFDRSLMERSVIEEFHVQRIDGALVPVRISTSFLLGSDAEQLVLAVFRDMSELAEQEQQLAVKKWALDVYGAASIALMRARTAEGLVRDICEAITRESPFSLAWVGFADRGSERRIRHGYSAGPAAGYLEDLHISHDEHSPYAGGPAGQAWRTGCLQVVEDIAQERGFEPWFAKAEGAGFRSVLSVPIDAGDEGRAVLTVYSTERKAFGPVVVDAFRHLGAQIGLGLQSLAQSERLELEREKREAAQQELGRALMGVVRAISTTHEMRDPYTAGHQEHVAELAYAISLELGMDEVTRQAVQIAAQLHDVGKISIPVDVLTKQGMPTEAEWVLLKEHPENGYRILKDVPFRGEVAEMVRQHHERLDGSGYPRGLKGGEILPGAMVLAVADIVESMGSARPYRPSCGVDEALKEIEREAGTRLDLATVMACVRLFREKGFELK